MELLSGSVGSLNERSTPFDIAKDNAAHFLVNMTSCAAYETLAQRINLINAMLVLPILSSSDEAGMSNLEKSTKKMYQSEMQEIETVIKIYCTLPGTPEA
tara:strand:+ start:221 stop:520 length:300 start_codon:yes stop_codon:yes gene_type:complete